MHAATTAWWIRHRPRAVTISLLSYLRPSAITPISAAAIAAPIAAHHRIDFPECFQFIFASLSDGLQLQDFRCLSRCLGCQAVHLLSEPGLVCCDDLLQLALLHSGSGFERIEFALRQVPVVLRGRRIGSKLVL